MAFKRVISWIRRNILRQKETVKTIWGEFTPEKIQRLEHRRSQFEKRTRRAVEQDIGKFMKHGKQASWYRKQVKAKKKVEED